MPNRARRDHNPGPSGDDDIRKALAQMTTMETGTTMMMAVVVSIVVVVVMVAPFSCSVGIGACLLSSSGSQSWWLGPFIGVSRCRLVASAVFK